MVWHGMVYRWHDRKQGGGFLGAMGSHMIDVLSFVTNQKIAQVNAQLLTMVPEKKDATSGTSRHATSYHIWSYHHLILL